ncbi:RIP metalloprotease RseP [Falsirhodobacter algicola]|uniref:Zinc metalloprotease n=1 Tax=Falsirhodobacter algicola TaxID=2692330 RepID=A0A8J8MSJ7_9RHOB|nr:RIP metalloprotease RseP [Falsirhodobacter algicola]QUS35448.1 RIP metalloprotease RseP [Falsirhodobacter algicola]
MDLAGLLPQFGGVLWTLAAFVVALSIIVTIHEYGHYIVGRLCGIEADVFSLGFGPVIASRVDRRGTRWQIAALPMGGYVRFKGDADAASGPGTADLTALPEAERRRTLHGAPLWARTATVAAGPIFNFVSAIAIFFAFTLWSGIAIDEPIVARVQDLPGTEQTLQPGDRILSLNGQDTPDLTAFAEVAQDLPPVPTVPYVVERAGADLRFDGPFPFPAAVTSVAPGSAASDAGVKAGDVITAFDGRPVWSFNELRDSIGQGDGSPVTLTLWRDGTEQELELTPRRQDIPLPSGGFETRWLIGLSGGLVFTPETRTPGPVEALSVSVSQLGTIITTSLSGLWHMITGSISTCNLQGPIGIAESSGAAASAGAQSFIWFIAILSVAVGMMNLFPIPALDGGHLVFYAVEAVLRRPPSPRVLQVLMTAGVAAILSLMVFALTNDIFCP